ncbi:unnamed protein product, partial [Cyprideis torosa]
MRRKFMEISQQRGMDMSFYLDTIYSRNRKLVVFDMDSTLISAEVIDVLADLAGVGHEVSAITEAAMRGELDFISSFRRRVALLRGLEAARLRSIAKQLPLAEGAEIVKRLGFDYVFANALDIRDGRVTGEVVGDIVDGEKKAQLLEMLAQREGISMEQTIAIGDGANDIPMINAAGLGVAFHAKPIVREKAGNTISVAGLDGLLYLMGIRDREISQEGGEENKGDLAE